MREIFPVHYEMRRRGTVPLARPLIKISPDLSGSQRDFPELKGRGSRRGKKWGWGNKQETIALLDFPREWGKHWPHYAAYVGQLRGVREEGAIPPPPP